MQVHNGTNVSLTQMSVLHPDDQQNDSAECFDALPETQEAKNQLSI